MPSGHLQLRAGFRVGLELGATPGDRAGPRGASPAPAAAAGTRGGGPPGCGARPCGRLAVLARRGESRTRSAPAGCVAGAWLLSISAPPFPLLLKWGVGCVWNLLVLPSSGFRFACEEFTPFRSDITSPTQPPGHPTRHSVKQGHTGRVKKNGPCFALVLGQTGF